MTTSFGYPSNEPCTVCGQHKDNQCEPRFCYTVCVDHQHVPPASLDAARQAYRLEKELKELKP